MTKKLLEFLKEPSTVQPKKRSKQSGGLVQHSTSEDGLSALLAAASTTPTIPAKQAITITPGVWGSALVCMHWVLDLLNLHACVERALHALLQRRSRRCAAS